MCNDAVIRRIAGIFVMTSVALAVWVHPAWLWFTAFVGFNLFQSGITNFCPPSFLLKKLGVPENGASCAR